MRKNRPGPSGCTLKSALAALPCWEMEPLFPARGALLSPISAHNMAANSFQTASTISLVRHSDPRRALRH